MRKELDRNNETLDTAKSNSGRGREGGRESATRKEKDRKKTSQAAKSNRGRGRTEIKHQRSHKEYRSIEVATQTNE